MTKVVFAWVPQPIGGMAVVQQMFMSSFLAFCTEDTGPGGRHVYGGYTWACAGYIPASRNLLVERFMTIEDADWLMMFDWDVTFTPAHIYALIDAADPVERPIISGCYVTYFGEDNALRPCWMHRRGDEEYVPVSAFTLGEIVPLTVVGMGFTLMHRSVFEDIKKNNNEPWPWFGHDIINDSRTGEDLTFCRRAREVGHSVWGHGGVLLGHTKAKMLTPFDMHQNPERSILNIGGQSKSIPLPEQFLGWKHVLLDIEPGPDVDIVMDARRLIECEDFGFDAVYMSHSLEHFAEEDIPALLEGVQYVLKPGGQVLIRVPDAGLVIRKLEQGVDPDDVAYMSPLGPITWSDMLHGHQKSIEAGHPSMAHKTAFTLQSLQEALVEAGFEGVAVIANEADMELVAQAHVA